jgi:DMSO reductase anchor subunit
VNSAVDNNVLFVLLPVILFQLVLQIAALVNLHKRDKSQIRWNNKLVWILIIVFGEMIGPIVYFVLGRIEGEPGAGSGD